MRILCSLLLACLFAAHASAADAPDDPAADTTIGRPLDIPQDIFAAVRVRCAKRYPDDYTMRVGCENNQFTAVRILRGDRRD